MNDVETLVREHLNREARAARFDAGRWEDRVTEGRRRPRLPGARALGIAAAAVLLLAGVTVPLVLVSGLHADRTTLPGASSSPSAERHLDVVDHDDGLAITIPAGWTFRQDPTEPIEPKNVFAVGSWAFPRGGECAPTAAQDDQPGDGALFWLIEYHGDQPVTDFPQRPERFELDPETLGVYECSTVPSYMVRFRDGGRYFQVHVAFGSEASESLEPEVLRALESLDVLTPDDCPTRTSYQPEILPTSGPPRTSVEVSGAIATGGNEGGGWGSPTTRIEAWWNLKPSEFGSVLVGNPMPAGPGPVESLGDWFADGGCGYAISFQVPAHEDVSPGTYPVVLLFSGPDVGGPSHTAQAAWFEVTG
jgi:hypothetical protein